MINTLVLDVYFQKSFIMEHVSINVQMTKLYTNKFWKILIKMQIDWMNHFLLIMLMFVVLWFQIAE